MYEPKNGMYLTVADFNEWQNYISEIMQSYNRRNGVIETEKNTMPMNITFVNTERCNFNCSYCYQGHKTNSVMSKETAKAAIDFIFDKEKINNYYDIDKIPAVILEFIGGEPLTEIELMDYLVEYFKFKAFSLDHPWATNYVINITSNGSLYKDERVKKFMEKNNGKVYLTITIDGNKDLHDKCRVFPDGSGTYDVVRESVDQWVKETNQPTTKVTLCPDNVGYLFEAMKHLFEIGIAGAHTNCVFEPGWNITHARTLYEQMKLLSDYVIDNDIYDKHLCTLYDETIGVPLTSKRNWCGGNGEMLAIGTDGRCFPCIRYMKYSMEKSKEQPIGDIYKGIDSKEDNKWLCELCKVDMVSQCQHDDNRKCLTCEIAQGCSLCTGFNYDYYGDPNHKATFICFTHKARVLANVYYWNKLYKKFNLDKRYDCNLNKETAIEIIGETEYNNLLKLIKG